MAYETIEVRVEADKVGIITLNRPKQLNALNDQLMDELGAAPERTLMIGDTTHDLQMARNARTAGLAVGFGAHPVEVLVAESPLACVLTPGELAGWLLANA